MNNGSITNGNSVADVIRGLIYSHNRANANTAEVHQARATLETVLELLIERGVLDRETLQARLETVSEKLRRQYIERGMAVAMQEFAVSKYEFKGAAVVNCEDLIHLCKAACCRIPLALSKEDVQEGIVEWDLCQPYIISQDSNGYCLHLDQGNYTCTVYEHRPIPCRGYDCRKDKRVWVDFNNRIVNPQIGNFDWPACSETESSPATEREN